MSRYPQHWNHVHAFRQAWILVLSESSVMLFQHFKSLRQLDCCVAVWVRARHEGFLERSRSCPVRRRRKSLLVRRRSQNLSAIIRKKKKKKLVVAARSKTHNQIVEIFGAPTEQEVETFKKSKSVKILEEWGVAKLKAQYNEKVKAIQDKFRSKDQIQSSNEEEESDAKPRRCRMKQGVQALDDEKLNVDHMTNITSHEQPLSFIRLANIPSSKSAYVDIVENFRGKKESSLEVLRLTWSSLTSLKSSNVANLRKSAPWNCLPRPWTYCGTELKPVQEFVDFAEKIGLS